MSFATSKTLKLMMETGIRAGGLHRLMQLFCSSQPHDVTHAVGRVRATNIMSSDFVWLF
jgi:hypothetical protein